MPDLNAKEMVKGMMDKTRTVPVTDSEKRARALRDQLDKAQKEGRPSLDVLEVARREQDAVDHDKSDRVIEQSFDFFLDANLRDGSSSLGSERVSAADSARDLAEFYLEPNGYASLSGVQKNVIRTQIKAEILKVTGGSELLAEYSTPARLNVFLDRYATDPDFRQTVRDVKIEAIDNPPDTASAQEEINTAKEAADAKQKELDEVNKKLTDFSDALIGPKGKKLQDMLDAAEKRDSRTTKTKYNSDLRAANGILAKYGARYLGNGETTLSPEALAAVGDADRATIIILSNALKTSDYEVADRRFNELTQEQNNLTVQKDNLKKEVADASASIELAKNNRAQIEQDYADRLANIVGTATRKYLEERKGVLPQAMDKLKEAEGALDASLDAAVSPEAVRKYFTYEHYNPRTHEVEMLQNEDRINRAIHILGATPEQLACETINPATGRNWEMTDVVLQPPGTFDYLANMGPDLLMQEIVESQINPVTGVNFTHREFNDRVNNDPNFIKNKRGDVIFESVKQGARIHAISEAQMGNILSSTEWGGADLIRRVFADDEVKACIAKSKEAGPIQKFLAGHKDDKVFWGGVGGLVLLSLLTGGAGPLALAIAAYVGRPIAERIGGKKPVTDKV